MLSTRAFRTAIALLVPLLGVVSPSSAAPTSAPAPLLARVAPVMDPIPNVTINGLGTVSVTPVARDTDGPRALSFTHTFASANTITPSGKPAWITTSSTTGKITGTAPKSATGMAWNVTVRASDGLQSASRTFTLTILNAAPTLADPGARTVRPGATFSIQLTGSDADGPKSLTYQGRSFQSWMTLGATTGVLSGTPPTSATGLTYAPEVRVYDGLAYSAWRPLSIQVSNNRPPVVTALPDLAATEDVAITPIRPSASDPDGDPVTLSVTGLPTGLTFAGGAIGGTPTVPGTFNVTVTATDGKGGTGTDVFVLSVANVNDAPVLGTPSPATVTGNLGAALDTSVAIAATDADGDPVTFAAQGLPGGVAAASTSSGVRFTGTPTEAGTFPVTVTATDGKGGSASTSVSLVISATPVTTPAVNVKVDFTTQAGNAASGYLKDFGEPFGVRTGANQGDGTLAYGWVKENSEEPLSLVGNARVRARSGIDPRLDSIMHVQYGDVAGANCTTNVCEDGEWQLRVPTGTYDVTVAVGDMPSAAGYDSAHAINIEGNVLIESFRGSTSQEYSTVTARVGVVDGELSVSPTGGTNTKIAFVEVVTANPANRDGQPFIVTTRPSNRSTGAPLGQGVATDLHLVGTTANPGPVDPASLNGTVKLYEVTSTGTAVEVAGSANTSGGGDTITFQQTTPLKALTKYRFVVNGAKDVLGNTFVPYTSLFTTGSGDSTAPSSFSPVSGVTFEKVDTGRNGRYFASLVVHNGYLWATTVGQGMFRYQINADGTLGTEQAINAFVGRAAIGLVFDKTDPNAAWVTNATANIGNETAEFGSKVTRVDFSTSVTNPTLNDVFVNLPRSRTDHLSNSIGYGPGDKLYFLQGSNQAAGDPDGAWGNRGETMLTAAMLTFDPAQVWPYVRANGAIDVLTPEKGGTYDPYATSAPLTIYASGIRNAYDFVYTNDGRIYAPTNGTASGANSPGVTVSGSTLTRTGQVAGQDVTNICATRRIDKTPYTAPSVPAITNHPTQRDFLFDVVAGGFYGHPNPTRCEWVLNNGGRAEGAGSGGSAYASTVLPDRNYRGWAYDFEFNKSPNGAIQYRTNSFGGKLKGRLMIVRFSNYDDIITLQQGADGKILGGQAGTTIGGFSGFDDPLDIVEDLTVNPGNLYVNSYDQTGGAPKLYLLRVPAAQKPVAVAQTTSRETGSGAALAPGLPARGPQRVSRRRAGRRSR